MCCCVGNVQHQPLQGAGIQPPVQPNPEHRTLWEKFGLDGKLYDDHLEFAEFLFETRLVYSIVGYQATMEEPAANGIQIEAGLPCILIQNEWRDFAWIQANMEYDPIQEWIHTKGNPNQIFTYVSPRLGGFIMQSRHYYENAFPVHQLNEEEMAALRKHAGAADDAAIYQLVSTPRPTLSDWIFPFHLSERVIMPDGIVYSFGGQPHPDLAAFIAPPGSSGCDQFCKGASTGRGVIAMSDYEEFKNFETGERLVTTFPITDDKAKEILRVVDNFQQNDHIRFNLLHQNCAQVATELTELAIGVHIENRVTIGQILANHIPEIPFFTAAWKTITAALGAFWAGLPDFITVPFEYAASVIFYIPNKILTFLSNVIILSLGGALQADDVQPVIDDLDNEEGMTQFSRLIRDITDMFQDHPSDVAHHIPVGVWQRLQPTTVSYQYDGPKMYMIPPLPEMPLGEQPV